jgi:hypothetical protein
MKLSAAFAMIIACLFILYGCAAPQRRNVLVIDVPQSQPIYIPEPEIKTLILVLGKTTRNDVVAIIGQPQDVTTYTEYNTSLWIYNLPPQHVILDISATGKDGFTYTHKWALGKGSKSFSLTFKGNLLSNFSL